MEVIVQLGVDTMEWRNGVGVFGWVVMVGPRDACVVNDVGVVGAKATTVVCGVWGQNVGPMTWKFDDLY